MALASESQVDKAVAALVEIAEDAGVDAGTRVAAATAVVRAAESVVSPHQLQEA